jgi:25S rRNA (uracil2843-N3)-methyltransferase
VVDSPGSYSETKFGNATDAKRYPMKWLLDHALLENHKRRNIAASDDDDGNNKPRGKDEYVAWEKMVEDDSRWFRIPEGLRYGIPLENMRYQIHLYRRL